VPMEMDLAGGKLGKHEKSYKNYIVGIFYLILLLTITPAAASSLSINSPQEFDVCGPKACSLNYVCDEDTNVRSASVQIPEAFPVQKARRSS